MNDNVYLYFKKIWGYFMYLLIICEVVKKKKKECGSGFYHLLRLTPNFLGKKYILSQRSCTHKI